MEGMSSGRVASNWYRALYSNPPRYRRPTHTHTSMPPKVPSSPPVVTINCSATGNAPPPQIPQNPIVPPGKIMSSLKTGKFHPVFASTPTPRQTESTNADPDDREDDPGIYRQAIGMVVDGTHLITTSFTKTNDKIRDQLRFFLFISPNACMQNSMASRFILSALRSHHPFQPRPRIRPYPQLATRSGIIFLYRTSSPLSPELKTNQKHPHRR
jgi:hypothetical protein